jgi:hypothetical protein
MGSTQKSSIPIATYTIMSFEPIVKSSKEKDVDIREDEITAKDIKEVLSISSSLVVIPTESYVKCLRFDCG